ncbi:hypothetical protein JVU11DRAFT_11373 [Chiua virens]|nr:hypothetical protein JVU11DRAFT_11373 [Chiua virens]
MKLSPDFMNITTGCPLEHHIDSPLLEEESVRDYASRHPQLSVSRNEVLDRLLVLLPSCLRPQPSRVSSFPPRLLWSICDALQLARLGGITEQNDVSAVLPLVLSKLRDWRLHDLEYRYSPGGIHKLALDLAGIINEWSFSPDLNQTCYGHLRVKWAPFDSPCESRDQELFSSTPSSPSTPTPRCSVLDSAQKCTHTPPDLGEHRCDATYASCQTRGTSDSEDAIALVSRRHPGSGFRSGCSACRHLRLSGPSPPSSPHMTSFEQRTLFFDTVINTCVASSRHRKSSVQHNMAKKTKREQRISLQPIAHNNENDPPLPELINVPKATGISFPRPRTHSPPISNAFLSWEPFSSVQRRVELNPLLNRPREGDKHTSSHRATFVDLRLPITGTNHLLHSPNRTSPIDFHPHTPTPTRAQSFLHSPVNSHALGSVAARVPPQSSNQNLMGSRSGRRLPSWSSSYLGRYHDSTATIAMIPSVKVKPPFTGSPTPPKAKTSVHTLLPIHSTRSRLSSLSNLPKVTGDMGVKRCDRRSIPSTQTHKHARNDAALPSAPFPIRKWRISRFSGSVR